MLILASASRRRRFLLRRMGLVFEIEPADVDETPVFGEAPDLYVERLALTKANEVFFRRHATEGARPETYDPGLTVIGADTVVVAPDGELLGKPTNADDAKAMLHRLSGREHRVITGVAIAARPPQASGVADEGRVVTNSTAVDTTLVRFAPLTDAEIDAYVATREPMDKAGAYGIQALGGNFVERIEGSYDNVVGLPTHKVAQMLGMR